MLPLLPLLPLLPAAPAPAPTASIPVTMETEWPYALATHASSGPVSKARPSANAPSCRPGVGAKATSRGPERPFAVEATAVDTSAVAVPSSGTHASSHEGRGDGGTQSRTSRWLAQPVASKSRHWSPPLPQSSEQADHAV